MRRELEENGLRPGDYDLIIDTLIAEGCMLHANKENCIRISLCRNTTWKEILKLIPKGSILKNWRQVR